ncbi:hypothetical protein [Stieleria varia]|nr:hypothetical protein [Stieleria varia]
MRLLITAGMFCCLIPISEISLAQTPNAGIATDPPSLQRMPADISFYFGIHRGGELFSMLGGRELADKLATLETDSAATQTDLEDQPVAVDLGIIGLELSDIASNADQIKQMQNSKPGLVFNQLFQTDAYLCGDESWTSTWHAVSIAIADAKNNLTDEATARSDEEKAESLHQHLKDIRVPNTLAGFHLSDPTLARELLAEWQASLTEEEIPWEIGEHRIDHESLTTLSVKLETWFDSLVEDVNVNESDLLFQQAVRRSLRDRSLHVSIGIIRNQLIVFVGEDLTAIDKLTAVPDENDERLVDTPEFAAAMPPAGQSHFATAYISDSFAKSGVVPDESGWMTNWVDTISLIARSAKVDGVPMGDMGMLMGVPILSSSDFSGRMKSLAQRWDALALPPAGWAMTVGCDATGISSHSVWMSVDPRLPDTPLNVDRYAGGDTVAIYARQGTTTATRCLLGFELVTNTYLGFMETMFAMMGDEGLPTESQRYLARLQQMPMRLSTIVEDKWFPALGDGGQALVATFHHAAPGIPKKSPIEFTLLSRVAHRDDLIVAGGMLRTWANSYVNQYFEMAKTLDDDDEIPLPPQIDPPTILDDGDSDIYTIATPDLSAFEVETVELDDDAIAEEETPEETSQTDFHWRLSDDILAIGSQRDVTKAMLVPNDDSVVWRDSEETGLLRSVLWIDFDLLTDRLSQIANANEMEQEEREEFQAFIDALRKVHSFHRVTHTRDGMTVTQTKLAMPLGSSDP